MWFWWMSYDAIRDIDKEILGLREELKNIYSRLRDLLALRKYHTEMINLHTQYVVEDYERIRRK